MNENVARPIAVAQEPPAFELNPNAHRIASDQEALTVARELAAEFAQDAAQRDRERRLPAKELDRFSGSGLWAITVPKAYGGAGVSSATLAEIIAIISAADPSLGQLPQNHLAALDAIESHGKRRAEAAVVWSCTAGLSPRQRLFRGQEQSMWAPSKPR